MTVHRAVLLSLLREVLVPEFKEGLSVGFPDRRGVMPTSRAGPLLPPLFCSFLLEEPELLDTGATVYLEGVAEAPPMRVLRSSGALLRSPLERPEGCESRLREAEPVLGAAKAAGGGGGGSRGRPRSVTFAPSSRGAFAALLRSSSF